MNLTSLILGANINGEGIMNNTNKLKDCIRTGRF